MNARIPAADIDPGVSRIEALPVNATHRASARAHYLAAERSIGRMFALYAGIRTFAAACRVALGLRGRSEY